MTNTPPLLNTCGSADTSTGALTHSFTQSIKPGDVVWTWCGVHMERTDHLWDGHILICLECHPEKKAKDE
jgi:hypothetical protein